MATINAAERLDVHVNVDSPEDSRDVSDPKGWIWTHTGRRVWPMLLRPTDVDIEDVAHALSNLCRFAGHVREFYSVAQHSVLASHIAQERQPNRRLVLATLLHDASEAYLIDLPRPVKRHPALAGYVVAERFAEAAIAEHFGLTAALFTHSTVKHADEVMLATERRDLFDRHSPLWVTEGLPSAERIEPWSPDRSRSEFLHRFHQLARELRP